MNSISLGFLGVGPRISVSFFVYMSIFLFGELVTQFFVFSLIDSAPSGSSSMSDEIRGLIGVLRRGCLNWSSFDQIRI